MFLAIKAEVDRNRRPGRFLLTGSANALVLPKLSESLAGRMEILALWPLSQGEVAGHHEAFIDLLFRGGLGGFRLRERKNGDVATRILRGGYPEAHSRAVWSRRRAWFNSYVLTILQRDVRDLSRIEGLNAMPRLLTFLASRVGTLLNHAEVSRSLGVPQSTLQRYMALLEATFLVQLLPAWSGNLGKRLVKSPKLYLNDTGLVAALLGQGDEAALLSSHLMGPLLENFVIAELRKQSTWSDTEPGLFHFRTLTGQEVDVVLEAPSGDLAGVEIKTAASVQAADFKGLRVLADETGRRFRCGVVLYQGRETVPFGKNLSAVPVQALWQA
jgi:predicted AAA+ superfamily ATPase